MIVQARTVNQSEVNNLMIRFDGQRRDLTKKLEGVDGTNPYIRKYLPWPAFRNAAILYIQALMGSKEIPSESKRDFDKAVKLFMGTTRTPNDPAQWLFKNYILLDLLVRAYRWPEKVEGQTESVFRVGPFIVHNNLGAAGGDLDKVKDALNRAASLIRATSIPNIDKVLYGDVMVVGNIAKGSELAWYYENEDAVYVRLFKKAGIDELNNLIHELGHRYIFKFMPRSTYAIWVRYHDSLKHKQIEVNVGDLKVGDPMPFKIAGVKGVPTIQKIENGKVYFTDTKFALEAIVKGWLRESARAGQRYPTLYSAKSADEHFCDSLALYAMGSLKEPFLTPFKTIVEQGQDPSVMKVASRWLAHQ